MQEEQNKESKKTLYILKSNACIILVHSGQKRKNKEHKIISIKTIKTMGNEKRKQKQNT